MKIKLGTIRRKKHITQEELANHVGVNKSFISRVETGTKDMSFPLAVAIADYLNVSLDDIAGRKVKAEANQNHEN